MNSWIPKSWILVALLTVPAGGAAQELLTPQKAVAMAVESHPRLRIVRQEHQRARLLIEQEEHRYDPTWTADGGFRFGNSPQLGREGTTLLESNSLVLSSTLVKTLPVGTQLSATVDFGRTFRDTVELGTLGTAYDTSLTLEVLQPLLRGAGKDVGEAALRAAQGNEAVAKLSLEVEESDLVYDVLNAYWQLWSAQRSLEIEVESRDVAQQELKDAEIRLSVGAIAPAQLIPIRIEVARANESVVSAQATVRQRRIVLAELVGEDAEAMLVAGSAAPEVSSSPSLAVASELAEQASPALARLQSRIRLAQVEVDRSKDATQLKLDALGSVSVAGLGTSASDALAQFGAFEALVFYTGLRLELPVWNRARDIEVERAQIAVDLARLELEQAQRNLRSQIAGLVAEYEAGAEQLALARETALLARQSVDAQSARFDAGKGTTLEIIDALESFRAAEFRVVEIQVSLAQKSLSLAHVTGQLKAF